MAVDDPAVMNVNTSTVYTIQFNNGSSFVYCDNGEIYYEGTHNAANAENANYQLNSLRQLLTLRAENSITLPL